jgi:hypothetical protein
LSWETYAKLHLPNRAESVDAFVAGVQEAIRQYGLDQALVKIYQPRQAKKKLGELNPIMKNASDALNELNSGTILMVSELVSQYNESSASDELEKFDELKKLLYTCTRNLVIAHAALSQQRALSGEKNPLTYAKIKFQKKIFLCYMDAFQLDKPPIYSDTYFRHTFDLILSENRISNTNEQQNFNKILDYLTAQ